MKRGRKIMFWGLEILAFLIIGTAIYFSIPYSPMKAEFMQLKNNQSSDKTDSGQVFAEEDIADLPAPLKKYF